MPFKYVKLSTEISRLAMCHVVDEKPEKVTRREKQSLLLKRGRRTLRNSLE
jgi:hypothetical protein